MWLLCQKQPLVLFLKHTGEGNPNASKASSIIVNIYWKFYLALEWLFKTSLAFWIGRLRLQKRANNKRSL